MCKRVLYFVFCILYCQQVYAGGVALGATRLIYPTEKDQATLKIYNSDDKSNYLVQSWISDQNDIKVSDFIITPPLFVIKAKSENVLRVVYTGDKKDLPKDREKLFFLNSKVIPSLTEGEQKIDNALLISTTTKIKLFIRPESIKENSLLSYEKLSCSYSNGQIKIDNPTPFYMNLVSLKVNGREISNAETISPKSSVNLNTKFKGPSLSYSFINDYGVQMKDGFCKL
ncbi:fimbrial biogenesis chaperone [Winslowiella sp. 2C04]|uniref:fimbrial biogenesis chaperone n=1 Tax=Winslowiella sp. 2C04 TaxID=3416179 RepID=UPI003CEB64BD